MAAYTRWSARGLSVAGRRVTHLVAVACAQMLGALSVFSWPWFARH